MRFQHILQSSALCTVKVYYEDYFTVGSLVGHFNEHVVINITEILVKRSDKRTLLK